MRHIGHSNRQADDAPAATVPAGDFADAATHEHGSADAQKTASGRGNSLGNNHDEVHLANRIAAYP